MRLPLLVLAVFAVVLPSAAEGANFPTGLHVWQIAGNGQACIALFCGDGADATSGTLSQPAGLAGDEAGNVYIADSASGFLRRISPTGVLTTYTTGGVFARVTAAGPAVGRSFDTPIGLEYAAGSLYMTVLGDEEVVRISGTSVTTVAGGAGNPPCATTDPCGDGGAATDATLSEPTDVAVDAAGNLYIADSGNNRIRKVTAATQVITTIAGDGDVCADPLDACGDAGAATAADLNGPSGVAVNDAGTRIYIADTYDNRIRLVSAGVITAFAGTGDCACSGTGDNGPAVEGTLYEPSGVELEPSGSLLIADTSNAELRRVDSGGQLTRIAGIGNGPCLVGFGIPCDTGQASGAALGAMFDVLPDGDGGVLATDIANNLLLWLTPSQPLGIPGPKGDKGDTGAKGDKGDAGANGSGGTQGPKGDTGDRGDQTPLATWVCRKRKRGIGRYAVSCFARVFADDGSRVRVRLVRGGKVFAADSALASDGEARLHLRSRTRLHGVYALRLTEQPASGSVRADSIRVAI